MTTKNKRVATYLPPEIESKFQDYMHRKGIKSESQAILQILVSVMGDSDKPPAIDRLTKLEQRIEEIEAHLRNIGGY